ncbi:hypothetical protein SAMN02800692_3606 [Luteibacter sp. UNC138MFCol5.1]|uniref:hypothetical protein n=1 Tax=Luteibacter sp. UNC138MFCol5.1 TaxID=1502774 RepID=UPI0008C88F4F|nr:hypothetical protein [Luteibacter sp. UNC138MFCol5.1]SEP09309.1 hypothetical protein SAMN02800692_3606 [Luteibacter sp. UNC138MFCol5.1]
MDRTVVWGRALLLRLPHLTVATALAYGMGVEFRIRYWRAMGLPLMASDRPFAETVREGFLGFSVWFSRMLTVRNVTVAILGAAAVYALARFAWGAFDRRLTELVAERRRNRLILGEDDRPIRPILRHLDALITHADAVVVPLSSAVIVVGLLFLSVLVPWTAVGDIGAEQGVSSLRAYEKRSHELRDGLVDIAAVSVRTLPGDVTVSAIPIECQGDRCAAMIEAGPISLPKDRFLEESVVKAVWGPDCLSEAGLRRRAAHDGVSTSL